MTQKGKLVFACLWQSAVRLKGDLLRPYIKIIVVRQEEPKRLQIDFAFRQTTAYRLNICPIPLFPARLRELVHYARGTVIS